jgi:hypothetical protein
MSDDERKKFELTPEQSIEYVKGVVRDNANLVVGQETDEQREALADTFNGAIRRWQAEVVDLQHAPRVSGIEQDGDVMRVKLELPGYHVEDIIFAQLAASTERHEQPEPSENGPASFTDFYKAVYEEQDQQPTQGYGWMQWKGTDVCVDLHCELCGAHGHFDGYFLYFYRCKCGQLYALGQNVKLIKLTKEQDEFVMRDRPNVVQEVSFDE